MSIPHLRSTKTTADVHNAPDSAAPRSVAADTQVWAGPIPRTPLCAEHPLVWLLGAHGGAAVSSLTASLEWAGDAGRRWPSGGHADSPLVAIVARTHLSGLSAAHRLLMQHYNGLAPADVRLLGLITVADTDRKLSSDLARELTRVESLAPAAWRLGWIEPWRHMLATDLPSWGTSSIAPADKRARIDDRRTPVPPIREHLHPSLLAAAATALSIPP